MAYMGLFPNTCHCWHSAAAPKVLDSAYTTNSCNSKSGLSTGCEHFLKQLQKQQQTHCSNCLLLNTQYIQNCYCNCQMSPIVYYAPPLPPPLPPSLPPESPVDCEELCSAQTRLSEDDQILPSRAQEMCSLPDALNLLNAPPPPAPPQNQGVKSDTEQPLKKETFDKTYLKINTLPPTSSTKIQGDCFTQKENTSDRSSSPELCQSHTFEQQSTNQAHSEVATTAKSEAVHSSDFEILSKTKSPTKCNGCTSTILTESMKNNAVGILGETTNSSSQIKLNTIKIQNFPKPKTLKPPSRPNKLRDCRYCEKEHPLKKCYRFLRMNMEKRWDVIEKFKYCANCLAHSHTTAECPCEERCKKCKEKHHRLLHDDPDKEHMRNRKVRAEKNKADQCVNRTMEHTNLAEMITIDVDDDEFEFYNIPLPDDVIIIPDDDEGKDN